MDASSCTECAVCQGSFATKPPDMQLLELPCDHRFCAGCIERWFSTANKNSCPSCRRQFSGLRNFKKLTAGEACDEGDTHIGGEIHVGMRVSVRFADDKLYEGEVTAQSPGNEWTVHFDDGDVFDFPDGELRKFNVPVDRTVDRTTADLTTAIKAKGERIRAAKRSGLDTTALNLELNTLNSQLQQRKSSAFNQSALVPPPSSSLSIQMGPCVENGPAATASAAAANAFVFPGGDDDDDDQAPTPTGAATKADIEGARALFKQKYISIKGGTYKQWAVDKTICAGPRADYIAKSTARLRFGVLNKKARLNPGHLPNIPVHTVFFSRAEMELIGFHGKQMCGIDFCTASNSKYHCPETNKPLSYGLTVISSGGCE